MSLRFHEIAETHHRIQNPFSDEKLALLGEICQPEKGMRHLDLACGKGELLSQWARHYGTRGVGVDISEVFIEAAKERAFDLEVSDLVHFVVDDAAAYPQVYHAFDFVSCLGATWIGGGLIGTLQLMQTALKSQSGIMLVGEPYWHEPPPPEVCTLLGAEPDTFATLAGTLDRFESIGLNLIEMVLANHDTWDRYIASQWRAVDQFLLDNPDDVDADALREWIAAGRRAYLTAGRHYMGWGVFVLRG